MTQRRLSGRRRRGWSSDGNGGVGPGADRQEGGGGGRASGLPPAVTAALRPLPAHGLPRRRAARGLARSAVPAGPGGTAAPRGPAGPPLRGCLHRGERGDSAARGARAGPASCRNYHVIPVIRVSGSEGSQASVPRSRSQPQVASAQAWGLPAAQSPRLPHVAASVYETWRPSGRSDF